MVCYNLGYKIITGKYQIVTRLQKFKASLLNTSAMNVCKSKHKGSTSQVTNPTYLHELYRQATYILGDDATFSKIAAKMKLLSTVEKWPEINLKKYSLRRWFKKNKGKEKQAVSRPLLMDEHKQTRLWWEQILKMNEKTEFVLDGSFLDQMQ